MASHRSTSYQPVVVPPHLRNSRRKSVDVGELLPVLATVSLLIVVLAMVYQLVA